MVTEEAGRIVTPRAVVREGAMEQDRLLRIGTRGSPLALIQAEEVRARLGTLRAEIEAIRTSGDAVQDRTLAAIGGKGLFTKEIDAALLAGAIDAAVHSMKDLPTVLPEGIVIAAVLPREDPRDALIAGGARSIAELPRGARLGTASLRRAAQALKARPDLRVLPLLAAAGLKRLGLLERASAVLEPEAMLPAVAQGAIGVAARADDAATLALLASLDDAASRVAVTAERSVLAVLDGSCRTPIAALARIEGERVRLAGLIVTPDGRAWHEGERSGPIADAAALGADLGRALRAEAGPGFFA
jgi:hydroxymethylbilane synthase